MDEITQKWLERAQYDLETARGMLRIRKYLYVVFMCQQSLEKALKALLSKQNKEIFPIHNLVRLAQEATVFDECEKMDSGLLAEITPFCIKARYGDYKRKISELCNRKSAEAYLKRTERIFKWFIKQVR